MLTMPSEPVSSQTPAEDDSNDRRDAQLEFACSRVLAALHKTARMVTGTAPTHNKNVRVFYLNIAAFSALIVIIVKNRRCNTLDKHISARFPLADTEEYAQMSQMLSVH